MRLSEITAAQRRLLEELAGRISTKLEAEFIELPNAMDTHIGVALQEGTRRVVVELPIAILQQASADPAGRETLRTRLKRRRDRMLFREPPARLAKNVAPLSNASWSRPGGFGGRR